MRYTLTKHKRTNNKGETVAKWRLIQFAGRRQTALATYDIDPENPNNAPIEARRELLRLEEGIAQKPVAHDPDDLTFVQLSEKWIAEQERLRDTGGITQHWFKNCETYKRQLLVLYGDRPLRDWVQNEDHLLNLFAQTFGLQAVSTQNNKRNALAEILEPAVGKRILGHNPAKAISIYATDHLASEDEVEAKSKVHEYDLEYFRAMCAHALEVMPGGFGVMTNFLCMTGLHVMEAGALRWRNVFLNVEYPRLHVVVSRRKTKDGWQNGGVKNSKKDKGLTKRDRSVPLPPPLVEMMRAWRVRSESSLEDDFVFPRIDGEPQNGADHYRQSYWEKYLDRFRDQFNEVRRANGYGEVVRITPIDCRHYYATRMLMQYGADWNRVADLLGHANADFTRKQYAKRFAQMEARGEVAVPATHRAIASGDFRL